MMKCHYLLGLTMCLAVTACGDEIDMESIKKKTKKQFPDLIHVEPEKVQTWLNEKEKVILLDVREKAEFQVSHLQGAKNVSPDAGADGVLKSLLADKPADVKVVLYCSVGVRSANMAKRLADAGVKEIYNMNGSIFQWANEGRPVFQGEKDNEKKVDKVHPYNRKWGKLLKPERRADVKPADGS